MKATILVIGLLAALAVGAVLLFGLLDDDPDPPSREALIEALAGDPGTTLDRTEAGCVLDAIEELGVDLATVDRDGLEAALPSVLAAQFSSQHDGLDLCLDAASRAWSAAKLHELDTAELRTFVADRLVTDAVAPLPKATAECVAERLVEAELVDDLVTTADGPITPELAAALLDAETECP